MLEGTVVVGASVVMNVVRVGTRVVMNVVRVGASVVASVGASVDASVGASVDVRVGSGAGPGRQRQSAQAEGYELVDASHAVPEHTVPMKHEQRWPFHSASGAGQGSASMDVRVSESEGRCVKVGLSG